MNFWDIFFITSSLTIVGINMLNFAYNEMRDE